MSREQEFMKKIPSLIRSFLSGKMMDRSIFYEYEDVWHNDKKFYDSVKEHCSAFHAVVGPLRESKDETVMEMVRKNEQVDDIYCHYFQCKVPNCLEKADILCKNHSNYFKMLEQVLNKHVIKDIARIIMKKTFGIFYNYHSFCDKKHS